MKEIELKLLVARGELGALRRRIGTVAEGRPKRRQLRTIYLDTADEALAAGGVALRLRQAGRSWTQTVKRGRSLRAGLSETEEIDVPAPGGRVDLAALPAPLAAEIARLTGGLPLAPRYETVVARTTWEAEIGGGRVEIALDDGEVVAGERREPILELEIERLEGAPQAIFAIARTIFPAGPLRFSRANKAARGRRVAAGEPAVRPPAPVHAGDPGVAPDATAEAAAVAILAECAGQVAANIVAVTAHDDAEGPHQLRVGLRRLRAAARLLAPALGDGGPRPTGRLAAIEAEARWLAGEVSRLRDLQVAREDLVAPAAAATPGETGFEALDRALADAVVAERAALVATLAGARVTGFVLDLAEYIALRGWLDPADHAQTARLATPFASLAGTAARRAEAKAARKARGIAGLEHEARHELRKALKMLRYIVEFGAPAWPAKRTTAFVKALKGLQTLFGALNDAAMAEALFLTEGGPGADDPTAQRAAGRLIGASNAAADHVWAEAVARWDAFAATKRPWA